jgi:hypothetical protein
MHDAVVGGVASGSLAVWVVTLVGLLASAPLLAAARRGGSAPACAPIRRRTVATSRSNERRGGRA